MQKNKINIIFLDVDGVLNSRAYVPDDFDWESHIGFFQCASFA